LSPAFAFPPVPHRLKVFDISGIQCPAIGRMLLNGVMSCKAAKAEPADCLSLVSVSSRAAQPFIK
jgi:hypothetical protein